MIEEYLLQEEVVENLWKAFVKLSEYKNQLPHPVAIKKNHDFIIHREERGLREILGLLQHDLSNRKKLYLEVLKKRRPADWMKEWLVMHDTLFKYVLKRRGLYRDIEVRFGYPGDEELHRVPKSRLVPIELGYLAEEIYSLINQANMNLEEQTTLMAKAHYKFIRIHPFADGNGRIGRVIIDQLCLAHGLPMAMGGYPRSNPAQRRLYHEAIQSCVEDLECTRLAKWIKEKISSRLTTLA